MESSEPWSVRHRPAPYSAMPWPPSATWSDCWAASPTRAAGAREFLTLAAALRAIPEIETILDPLARHRPPLAVWP